MHAIEKEKTISEFALQTADQLGIALNFGYLQSIEQTHRAAGPQTLFNSVFLYVGRKKYVL